MKELIKKMLIMFMVSILLFSMVSCNVASSIFGNGDGSDGNSDNLNDGTGSGTNDTDDTIDVWDVNTVYAKARSLGYEGSLKEFIDLVSGADGKDGTDGKDGKDGKDGLGIKSSYIDSFGHLIIVLSDGTKVDAGLVKTPATNQGVFQVTFDYGTGEKLIVYSNNYRVEAPETPNRPGYEFKCWTFVESSLNTELIWYFDAYAVTKDMTLFAQWEELNNGGTNPDFPGGGEYDEHEWWDDINYSETDLIFQMTNCANRQELPSGCERYLAGVTKDGKPVVNEPVDELVRARNDDAYAKTKVNVKYLYYPDNYDLYGYSFARNQIASTIDHSSAENCPDIFCNWMTDMLLCSLKGYFANVMTQDTTNYGNNYFNIKLSTDEEQNQYGYMTDLMRSLTLNMGQVYVIASDYFIDLIRSFYVVPVNVNLFNTAISNGKLQPALTDLTGDNKVDIDDFFKEVDNGDWTYDRLIQYSEAIYSPAANSNGTESCNDILGFALGKNYLPAAGMIYSSSAVIIQKTFEYGKYFYTYPSTPTREFQDVIKGISDMVDAQGVYVMDANDAGILGLQGDEKTALLGIRKKFTTNELLFGGVVLLGSLEHADYTGMAANGGFGVVPVPVYQKGDLYLTQIHVTGRAGGITAKTTKFSQCSAFIQYQSTHSREVLDYYYEYNLSDSATAGGVTGNLDMLEYIRNNVRTSFDKLFEDAIGLFFDNSGISDADRYHTLLANYEYKFDDFTNVYRETVDLKKSNLAKLELEYAKLPQ